jgi:predicted nucleic acid-binding protein
MGAANVGFADAFLGAGAGEEKAPVASFDRDLDKFKGVARYDPAAQREPEH